VNWGITVKYAISGIGLSGNVDWPVNWQRVVRYCNVVRLVALLPSPVTQCYSAVPGIFNFFHGRCWQKVEKSSVNDKGKNTCVHGVARYTRIYIKYALLISGKLGYPANLCSRRCRISQILLYGSKFIQDLLIKVEGNYVLSTFGVWNHNIMPFKDFVLPDNKWCSIIRTNNWMLYRDLTAVNSENFK
jgi:hypothetical protein